jgi:hypothetical protein
VLTESSVEDRKTAAPSCLGQRKLAWTHTLVVDSIVGPQLQRGVRGGGPNVSVSIG